MLSRSLARGRSLLETEKFPGRVVVRPRPRRLRAVRPPRSAPRHRPGRRRVMTSSPSPLSVALNLPPLTRRWWTRPSSMAIWYGLSWRLRRAWSRSHFHPRIRVSRESTVDNFGLTGSCCSRLQTPANGMPPARAPTGDAFSPTGTRGGGRRKFCRRGRPEGGQGHDRDQAPPSF